jgi:hypothetical protein
MLIRHTPSRKLRTLFVPPSFIQMNGSVTARVMLDNRSMTDRFHAHYPHSR